MTASGMARLRERRRAFRGMGSRARVANSRKWFRRRPRDRWRSFVGAESRELAREFDCYC